MKMPKTRREWKAWLDYQYPIPEHRAESTNFQLLRKMLADWTDADEGHRMDILEAAERD